MFTPGSRACAYKTASGLDEWPSRDPLRENGGINIYELVSNDPIDGIDSLGLENRWQEKWTGTVDRWRDRAVGWTAWETRAYKSYSLGNGLCRYDEDQWRVQLQQKWGFKTKTRWEESRSWAYEIVPKATGLAVDVSEFVFSEAALAEAAGDAVVSAIRTKVCEKGVDVVLEDSGWKEVPGTRTTFTSPLFGEMNDGPPEPFGDFEYRHLVVELPCNKPPTVY